MEWLKRTIGRLYATLVKDEIPFGFRSHVFVMRITGIRPTATDSPLYKWLTIAYFLFVGIIFPLSLFMNTLFAHSIEEALEPLLIALLCWANASKAAVIYWHRNSIRDISRIHADLLRDADRNAANEHEQIGRKNFNIHAVLTILYFMSWCSDVARTIFLPSEEGTLLSTSCLPFEFADSRLVYFTVLVYQFIGALAMCMCMWVAMMDALPIALIITACGHVAQLKQRLRNLGSKGDNLKFYDGVVECCERYEGCLRYV